MPSIDVTYVYRWWQNHERKNRVKGRLSFGENQEAFLEKKCCPKKTNSLVNSLTVRYFNFDHNNEVVESKLIHYNVKELNNNFVLFNSSLRVDPVFGRRS